MQPGTAPTQLDRDGGSCASASASGEVGTTEVVNNQLLASGNATTQIIDGTKKLGHRASLMFYAAAKGDWHAAELLLDREPGIAIERITRRGDRPLHIAVAYKRTEFVRQLVSRLSPNELVLLNDLGLSALHFAISSDEVEIASLMVPKSESLILIPFENMSPLRMAILLRYKNISSYLYEYGITHNLLKALPTDEWLEILPFAVLSKQYDFGLSVLETQLGGAGRREKDFCIARCLYVFASHDLTNISATEEAILNRVIKILGAVPNLPWLRGICEHYLSCKSGWLLVEKLCSEVEGGGEVNASEMAEVTLEAARRGNVSLLTRINRMDPDILLAKDKKGQFVNFEIYSIFTLS